MTNRRKWGWQIYLWRDLGLHVLILNLKTFVFVHKFLLNTHCISVNKISLFHREIQIPYNLIQYSESSKRVWISCMRWCGGSPEPGPAVSRQAYCAGTSPWAPSLSAPAAPWRPWLQWGCRAGSGSPCSCCSSPSPLPAAGCGALRPHTHRHSVAERNLTIHFDVAEATSSKGWDFFAWHYILITLIWGLKFLSLSVDSVKEILQFFPPPLSILQLGLGMERCIQIGEHFSPTHYTRKQELIKCYQGWLEWESRSYAWACTV